MDWVLSLAVGVGGGVAGALATYAVGIREIALRRRTETIDRFLRVASVAHGRSPDHEGGGVGLGEQVAAIFLLADLGRRDRWLRRAAVAFLEDMAKWDPTDQGRIRVINTAVDARQQLQGFSRTWWGLRRGKTPR